MGLPRGVRFTMVFSSFEKQSRLVKSGSCFPGEKHRSQLSCCHRFPGALGLTWGSTGILLRMGVLGALGIPCVGLWPLPAVVRAGHQAHQDTGAPAELKSEQRGRPTSPGAAAAGPRGVLRQDLFP